MTQQEAQKLSKSLNQQQQDNQKEERKDMDDKDMDEQITEENLIQKYNEYLQMKDQVFDLTEQDAAEQ